MGLARYGRVLGPRMKSDWGFGLPSVRKPSPSSSSRGCNVNKLRLNTIHQASQLILTISSNVSQTLFSIFTLLYPPNLASVRSKTATKKRQKKIKTLMGLRAFTPWLWLGGIAWNLLTRIWSSFRCLALQYLHCTACSEALIWMEISYYQSIFSM